MSDRQYSHRGRPRKSLDDKLVRLNVSLTTTQIDLLTDLAGEQETSIAEQVREIIDTWIDWIRKTNE